jgi:hypothetical protein
MESLARAFAPDGIKRLVEIRTDPLVQRRIDDLAARFNHGSLTDIERSEYHTLIRTSEFISLLQQKARELL